MKNGKITAAYLRPLAVDIQKQIEIYELYTSC